MHYLNLKIWFHSTSPEWALTEIYNKQFILVVLWQWVNRLSVWSVVIGQAITERCLPALVTVSAWELFNYVHSEKTVIVIHNK